MLDLSEAEVQESMDYSDPGSGSCSGRFDIFDIYHRFCDIRSGNANVYGEQGYEYGDESRKANCPKEVLAQLLKLVEARFQARFSIFDELFKLMSRLDLMVDFSEFCRFYDFVFFMCRENGQKNITVSRAITAWKLVLAGRFRLLNQWCEFVEKNQRHNISEDTWQQVLAFSRCVHENLEGYDPEGAWPVLIDDFVEHMYRVLGSNDNANFFCSCGDPESESCQYEDSLPGLRSIPGLKRKSRDLQDEEMIELEETPSSPRMFKRFRCPSGPRGASKSPCSVERCLSKGFAGLFSSRSCLQLGQERRVSS